MTNLNKTAYAILVILSIDPMSGYEMRQLMKKSTKNFWSESDGQLYPALAKLAKQGFISCKSTKESSLRKKNLYSITSKELAALKQWLAQEPETHSVRNETILKLFFGANVDPSINQEHIAATHYRTKLMLAELTETKRQLSKEHNSSAHVRVNTSADKVILP